MKAKLYLLTCIGLVDALIPAVRADEWDQKTIFTFSAPVEAQTCRQADHHV
jgi:hypothetical protein